MNNEFIYVLMENNDGCWIAYSLDQAIAIMLSGCRLQGFAESEEGVDLLIKELMEQGDSKE